MRFFTAKITFFVFSQSLLFSSTFLVTSNNDANIPGTFRYALNNAVSGDIIEFQVGIGTIILSSNLPVITQGNLEIIALETLVIDGGNSYRVFSIGNNSESPTVTISNISVINGLAEGGAGGYTYYGGGGGGGLGAGGGFFIKGNAVLDSISISGCQAVGGMGGDAGDLSSTQNSGGGAGGASFSAVPVDGQNAFPVSQGGNGGGDGGGSGATTLNQAGGNAIELGGGGGGAAPGSASPGQAGGNGGIGLYGGGGGGAGSGATESYAGGNGGSAGFGAGGGGAGKGGVAPIPTGGSGGVLGGNGGSTDLSITPYFLGAGGGGGAGIGGAIFVYTDSSLTLEGSPSISNGAVIGGNGGTTLPSSQNGSMGGSFAEGIFLDQGATLALQGTFEADFAIDSYPSRVDGGITLLDGVVTLSGINTYAGGTTLSGGTLIITSANNIGGSDASITFAGGELSVRGTIALSGTYLITDNSILSTEAGNTTLISSPVIGSNNKSLTLTGEGTTSLSHVIVNSSDAFVIVGEIGGGSSFTLSGGGELQLLSGNTYSGGTTINAGILNIQNSSALGSGPVLITSGAQLQIEGGITVANSLTLNGIGAGTGALLNILDSNTYSGAITLSSPAAIESASGTLTLNHTNAISGMENLTFGGSGNTTVTGIIATGGGTLTKNGSGILTLSGVNTYSGETSLNAGQITLNASAGLGTSTLIVAAATTLSLGSNITIPNHVILSGTFSDHMTIEVLSEKTATISGLISGGLLFTKTGLGTLILTNANTYTTGTAISAGTLNIQNSTALGSGPISVADGTQLQVQGGITAVNALTLNGTGGGAGALLNISGRNTYSGAITLGSSTTIGSISGVLILNSPNAISGIENLTVDGSGDTIISGGISILTGAIIKNGSGILTLSGANTYSGGTTVNAGILSVSSADNIGGSSAGFSLGGGTFHATGNIEILGDVSVTDNSTIQTDASMATILTGKLTGSNGKVLTLGGPGTNSLSIVAVNSSDLFTVAGVIGGQRSLTKTGTGTLILSSSNTYTGSTTVLDGKLIVNGSIAASTLTLSPGTTLKGTGIVGPLIVSRGATVAPGNSIGTMHSGPVIFNTGSILSVEIDPKASSFLNVNGAAVLAGSVKVVVDPGTYSRKGEYQILKATSISGAFDPTVIGGAPGYRFFLNQVGNNIYLSYTLNMIATSGLTGNALKIARHLNQNAKNSTLSLLDGLTGESLKTALNSVSPARNAFGTYIAAQTAFSVSNLVSTHLDGLRFSKQESSQNHVLSALIADSSDRIVTSVRSKGLKNKFSAWVSGFGEFAHQAASLQNPSFKYFSQAALAGLDYQGENKILVGSSLGYAHTHYHEDAHAGYGSTNYYFASFYGNGFLGNFYFSPAVWGMFNQSDNTRDISFPGFHEKAHSDIFAWQLIPHLEVGCDVQFSWGDIFPFISADWAISWQRGYEERGASSFNVKQKANHSSMVRGETGLKFCEKWEKGWGAFFLKEKVSYVFEKPFGIGTVNTVFVGMPGVFTVSAVNQNLNLGAIGINFLIAVGKEKPVKIDFGYEGEFGSSYLSNELMLTVSKAF